MKRKVKEQTKRLSEDILIKTIININILENKIFPITQNFSTSKTAKCFQKFAAGGTVDRIAKDWISYL